jgi:penicillin-binding protein 1A
MSRLSWILSFLVSLALTGIIALALVYVYLESQLPDVSQLKDLKFQVPLQVYTRDGKLIGEFGPVRRAPVTYEQIPPLFIKALLSTEDQRFFEHPGVDIYGLFRAVANLAFTGTKSQGGSTITMQVARNFYLTREKTYTRKIEEILLALKIDQELSKERILELYLNQIFFGQQAYGIAAAAQVYYGKTLNQLTLAEMAMLAGLPQAPSAVNPITNPIAAKTRRDHVLERMVELGTITKSQYDQAIDEPLNASYHGRPVEVWAPYAGEMARTMMASTFGDDVFTQAYKVYTTVDSQLQQDANQAVRTGLLAYDQRHGYRGPITHLPNVSQAPIPKLIKYLKMIPYANGLRAGIVLSATQNSLGVLTGDGQSIGIPSAGLSWTRTKSANHLLQVGDVIWVNQNLDGSWQLAQVPDAQAAFVSLDPNTGAITSLVGGFDFRLSNFNRVVQAQRQPGSGFKPFIYSAALDYGYTLASTFSDEPITLSDPSSPDGVWQPQDDESDQGKFDGPVRLREALAHSLNLVSIRVLQSIGVDYAVNYISRFGFDPKQLPRNLTIALGTPDITPLQLANGYAVFANGGYRVNPYVIDKVTDSSGKVVFQYQPKPPQRILSPETDFLMVSALKTVINEGTGSKALTLDRSDLAGKTGTTNDKMDSWFNGFNGDIVATAWIGYDQPKSIKEYGAQAALPIWINFMGKALQGKPEHTLPQPSDIISAKIDPATGLLANEGQGNAISEYFTDDTVPKAAASNAAGPAGSGTSSDSGEPIF